MRGTVRLAILGTAFRCGDLLADLPGRLLDVGRDHPTGGFPPLNGGLAESSQDGLLLGAKCGEVVVRETADTQQLLGGTDELLQLRSLRCEPVAFGKSALGACVPVGVELRLRLVLLTRTLGGDDFLCRRRVGADRNAHRHSLVHALVLECIHEKLNVTALDRRGLWRSRLLRLFDDDVGGELASGCH
jgi:hypothetical protein